MDRCPRCRLDVGPPNVREVQRAEELSALEARFRSAKVEARDRNADGRLDAFETAIRTQSRAVINMWPSLLAEFLYSGRALYSNYTLQIAGQMRKPASIEFDRGRRGVEGILFGNYASDIRYAALSLDGRGLVSYGTCAVTIADVTTSATATVLEENSYTFVRRHKLLPGDDTPLGYRAAWADRHKLAVAKLAPHIDSEMPEEAFPSTLLRGDGERDHDEFLEVHIYGHFDDQAIERVVSPVPAGVPPEHRADLTRIRDRVKSSGKTWVER
jgi:hypothetical protein